MITPGGYQAFRFLQAPALAGLNDSVEKELARTRQSNTIPVHSSEHISDEVFARLYGWIKLGCVRDECYQ